MNTNSLEYNLLMTEKQYPDYVHRVMDEAECLLTDEDDPGPCEAAGLCFDILALFPEHEDSPVDWSYLDAIERREIDVSKFPRWAREFLNDIDDPEQRIYTEEMLLEQFSNKSLYDDAYFEKEEDAGDEDLEDSHP
jgi:hypothetical protein